MLRSFIDKQLPRLINASDGNRVIADIKRIIRTERWNSFDRFHETSRTLASAYEKAGARAEIYSAPTGGGAGSGKWVIQEAADILEATLDIETPVRKRVLDYARNPWHVVQWSASTPREGLRGELLIIDSLEELAAQKSLAGKIVLTRLSAWNTRAALAAKGAGVVIFDTPVKDLPPATPWTKFGWGALPLESSAARIVGLVLSENDGQKLRELLRRHTKLTLYAKVRVDYHVASHDVVSGIVSGRDDPQSEVWAVAHSAEPGALDNASGVAVCIEIARILNALISSGKINPPRRSIRLLHGYECYGFFHYLEHQKRFQTPLAGVCIDTVGAVPESCGRSLKWHATVPGSADFVDGVGEAILRAALAACPAGYALQRKEFVSTEDTLLGDPKFGFPCPWITNHPFRGYHSSADTPELLHAPGLRQCAAAMAGYLYYLADAGTAEALELAGWQTRQALQRIGKLQAPTARTWEAEKHAANLQRLRRFVWSGKHSELTQQFSTLEAEVQSAIRLSRAVPARRGGDAMIPRRLAPLAPMPDNAPGVLSKVLDSIPKAALFLADGQRSLAEIRERLDVAHGLKLEPAALLAWFRALEKIRFVELLDPQAQFSRERIVRDLKKLGVRPGMDLMVHSAMSKLGPVHGGADTVIDALLEILGPAGTLLAPSFNHFDAKLFNALTTPTTNGAIPDALWRRKDAIRSVHPSHSVCAIGARARNLCSDHLENGIWAANSPIGRLIHGGGYILSLGVGHESSTAYHIAEISLGSKCLDQFGSRDRLVTPEGAVLTVRGLAWRAGECPVDPRKLNDMLTQCKLSRCGKVGLADAMLTKAVDIWHARREQLKGVCANCSIKPEVRNNA